MRRVLIVVILIVAAAVLGLWRTHGVRGLSEAVGISNDPQGEARDEVRKSFQLQPGARYPKNLYRSRSFWIEWPPQAAWLTT